jgi:predicted O-methyltransferase YrrM
MLQTITDIYVNNTIERPDGSLIPLHSHTSMAQGLFLQEVMDDVKPVKSVEVGLAYGLSSLFILEKHREYSNGPKSHIMIEPGPDYWEGVAEHNIEKSGLTSYADYRYDFSDKVLPQLYSQQHKVQFGYIDTTKIFDIVLQDFYFIDKILEVGGVIVLDDCGGNWQGVQKVARYINSLPHYKLYKRHQEVTKSSKFRTAEKMVSKMINLIPFKRKIYPSYSFRTDRQLGINYYCLAFRKLSDDKRDWSWDAPF